MRLRIFTKVFLIVLAVFCVLSACSLSALAYGYRDRFYPGVRVAGLRLGGTSREQGRAMILAKVKQYRERQVVVTLPDVSQPREEATGEYPQVEVATTAEALGLSFAGEEAADAGWAVGRQHSPVAWLRSVVPAFLREERVPLGYSINKDDVRTFIDTKVVSKISSPVAAKLRVEGDKVVIDEARPGLEVDEEDLVQRLAKALPGVVDGDTTYIRAPVTQKEASVSRADLQPYADQLDALGNLDLALKIGSKTVKPERSEVLRWFNVVQGDDGKLAVAMDEAAIGKYLDGRKADRLDAAASLAAVKQALQAALAEQAEVSAARGLSARTVALVQKPERHEDPLVPGDYTPGLFPGKYVLVNLKEQRLYQVEGSNLIGTYRVSTGKWSTPTPKGTFHIASKVPRAYSRSFHLYMPYWMNFVGTDNNGESLPPGSYGLHELPEWPNGYKEGQSHLGTPVSHGCIRLGVGDAATVYAWADIGTPVVVR